MHASKGLPRTHLPTLSEGTPEPLGAAALYLPRPSLAPWNAAPLVSEAATAQAVDRSDIALAYRTAMRSHLPLVHRA